MTAVVSTWGRRLALAVVGLVAIWLVVGASGSSESGLRLGDVSAWLVSEPTGEATLADGSTVDVVVSNPVAEAGSPMRSVQAGPSAYVIDDAEGAVVFVDGATFETSTPTRFATGAGDALDVFVDAEDPAVVYVVNSEGGEISRVEAKTLGVLDRVSFGGTASSGAVSDGVLWVTDESSGTVRRVGAGDSSETSVGSAGDELAVVLVESGPAVVNRATRTVSLLDDDGNVDSEVCFDVRADVAALVSGSSDRWVLASVPEQGNLLIVDTRADRCTIADVSQEATELGAPVEEGGSVFVADHSTGEVVIIDPETGEEIARTRELVEPGTAFELFADDGFVWFNDPGSETAGVVNADGTDTAFDKYDPDGEDDDAPAPEEEPPEEKPEEPPAEPDLACGTFPPRAGQVDTDIVFEAQASEDVTVDRYVWDFDDGTQPEVGRRVTHTFTELGEHEVAVTAELAGGRTTTAPCPFEVSEEPVELAAAFTAPDVGVVGEPVDIADASIGATEWIWLFQGADEPEVEGPDPAPPVWSEPGGFSLSLRISDGDDKLSATSQSIEIIEPSGDPLDASFDVSDDTPTRGETVELTSTSTGDITGWTWSFGDGMSGTGEKTSHEYTEAGTYTAMLTIEDPEGETATATHDIEVGHAPVSAIAAVDTQVVDSASPVNFTDHSIGDVASVSWDFDSNGIVDSTESSPNHTYATPGVYAVTLTATGEGGDVSTDASLTITVSQAVAFVGDYAGRPEPDAMTELTGLGFTSISSRTSCSSTGQPAGFVTSNAPVNQNHPLNSPIDLDVSDGSHQTVPNVLGQDWATAVSSLGSFFNVTGNFQLGARPGGVYQQSPQPGPTCGNDATLWVDVVADFQSLGQQPDGSILIRYEYHGPNAFQLESRLLVTCASIGPFETAWGQIPPWAGSTAPGWGDFNLENPTSIYSRAFSLGILDSCAPGPPMGDPWTLRVETRAVATEIPGAVLWSLIDPGISGS